MLSVLMTNYDTDPWHAAGSSCAVERNPPAFQGGHREYRGFGLERRQLRVVYGGWDDAKVVLGAPSTGSCLAPAVRAARPTVTCNVGRRGGLSRHRYTSREVLLGPVDET
jgi:hypothetical protein